MMVVCSAKYTMPNRMVWEDEFIIEDLDITSTLVHASFTFSSFNDTSSSTDRFLSLLYEDNTVVSIDMHLQKIVVKERPFQKLEALGLIAREKLS